MRQKYAVLLATIRALPAKIAALYRCQGSHSDTSSTFHKLDKALWYTKNAPINLVTKRDINNTNKKSFLLSFGVRVSHLALDGSGCAGVRHRDVILLVDVFAPFHVANDERVDFLRVNLTGLAVTDLRR